jgi:hypothetical protein
VDAAELCSAVRQEDNHLLRAVLWEILEYAPPDACLRQLAEGTVADIDGDYRDYAFSYLARSYPELREDLEKKYAEDSDPFLQDALGRFCSDVAPSKALGHWMRCLESPDMPAELEEMVPFSIASVATANDLVYLEQRAKEAGASPIWKVTADMTRQRLRERM